VIGDEERMINLAKGKKVMMEIKLKVKQILNILR
jgi:hypothetical protein